MARKRRKKALYEVIGGIWSKDSSEDSLGKYPPKAPEDEPAAKGPSWAPRRSIFLKKPRLVQLNAGRFEMSISYQLAIAIMLGFVLVVLIAFQIGKSSQPVAEELSSQQLDELSAETESALQNATDGQVASDELTGNNRIVIQTYQLRSHLEPVKQYFASFGVETEIKKIDDWYYLVTENKYDNPEKPGTNGYFAKQRIIELGADYKAPTGYESFKRGDKTPFHDAFGMNFND
ncbi:MAG: hypothetical protein ACYS18_06550 [Planctomycetota bacterium]|jgi:hypothetical protein